MRTEASCYQPHVRGEKQVLQLQSRTQMILASANIVILISRDRDSELPS